MKVVILDVLSFGETPLGAFKQFGDAEIFQTTSADETLKHIQNADVIVTNKVVITAEAMLACDYWI